MMIPGGGGGNVGGGGPSIRFEDIILELSSFAGCQFDFGKHGSLMLSFDAFTGTVTLQSPSHSCQSAPKMRSETDSCANALPLYSMGSEAGSLGILDGADAADAVAMDQSDYDMALSQLENGDSPQSFSVTAAAAAATAAAAGSPSGILFNSPSAMRHACEGKHEGTDASIGGDAAATNQAFAALVSPSSSLKCGGSGAGGSGGGGVRGVASVIARQQQQQQQQQQSQNHNQKRSPGVGPRNGNKKQRSSPASVGITASTISPEVTSPAAAAADGKPKGKRARLVRDENGVPATSAAAHPKPKAKTKANNAAGVSVRRKMKESAPTAAASKKRDKRAGGQEEGAADASLPSRGPGHDKKTGGGGRGGRSEVDKDLEVMNVEDDHDSGDEEGYGDMNDQVDGQNKDSDNAHGGDGEDDDDGDGEDEDAEDEMEGKGDEASPCSSAAAAWIASTTPVSPGPLSRSAKAQVLEASVANKRCSAPMGRWGHTATMITESTMMVLGGQADDDAHQATLGDLHKFDFETESWSRPVNCDTIPRAWHTASLIKDKNLLVIFGGERTVDGCPECLDDIMVLDTDIDLLYPPAISGKSPTARSGHSAAIIGTDLVVFGGVRGRKWQNNVAVLDTERWHWRHPTIDGSNPAPRSYHSATVVGNLMVVFGGNNQNESFDKIHVLDTSKSRWVWLAPEVVGVAPPPRTGHSAVLLPDGHTILVHGGWDPEDEGGVKNFGDAYLLDTSLWEWSRGPESLLGADEVGRRVGHTALLARCPDTKSSASTSSHGPQAAVGGDGAGGSGGVGGNTKVAIFGGQDGAGVRRSELALLPL